MLFAFAKKEFKELPVQELGEAWKGERLLKVPITCLIVLGPVIKRQRHLQGFLLGNGETG